MHKQNFRTKYIPAQPVQATKKQRALPDEQKKSPPVHRRAYQGIMLNGRQ
jgi:hypothetical protein